MNNDPYLTETQTVTERKYNPEYGDDRICECGHPYYRHFDSFEGMAPVGCKYCHCDDFREGGPGQIRDVREMHAAVLRGTDLCGYRARLNRDSRYDDTHRIDASALFHTIRSGETYQYSMLTHDGHRCLALVEYDYDDTKSVFVRVFNAVELGSTPLAMLFAILDPFLSDLIWLHPRLYPKWLADAYQIGPTGDPHAGDIEPIMNYIMNAIPDDIQCRRIGAILSIIDVERIPHVYGIALLTGSYCIRELIRPQWMRFRDRVLLESHRIGAYNAMDWLGLEPASDGNKPTPDFVRMILRQSDSVDNSEKND